MLYLEGSPTYRPRGINHDGVQLSTRVVKGRHARHNAPDNYEKNGCLKEHGFVGDVTAEGPNQDRGLSPSRAPSCAEKRRVAAAATRPNTSHARPLNSESSGPASGCISVQKVIIHGSHERRMCVSEAWSEVSHENTVKYVPCAAWSRPLALRLVASLACIRINSRPRAHAQI